MHKIELGAAKYPYDDSALKEIEKYGMAKVSAGRCYADEEPGIAEEGPEGINKARK